MGIFDKKSETKPETRTQTQAAPAADTGGSIFDRIGKAEPPGVNRNRLTPGVYPALYVDSVGSRVSENPNCLGDTFFYVNFLVLESNVPERPAGTKASWSINMRYAPSAGEVRQFIAVLVGEAFENIGSEEACLVASPVNPAHGRLIGVEVWNKKSEKTGRDFPRVNWIVIPEENQEKGEALRVEIFGS